MTIYDIANKAITSPSDLQPAEITRLGTWIVDHVDHIRAHREMMQQLGEGQAPAPQPTGLTRRLGPAPGTTQPAGTALPLPADEPQTSQTETTT